MSKDGDNGLINSKLLEPRLSPPHYSVNVKMSLLEDRAHFFEGQLNPLHSQNIQLKEQLIYTRRVLGGRLRVT